MTGITLVIFALLCAALFVLGRRRALFPYLLVFVLGLEYFSPGAADSVFTIPKMGFLSLMASRIGSGSLSRVFTGRGIMFPLVVFAGYMVLTILWSVDPGRSATRGTSLMLLLVLFVVVQGFVRTPTDLQTFWRAFLLYGLISAAMTVYQVVSGTSTYVDELGIRAGGLGVNPTEGSFYTGISLLVLMAYFARGLPLATWMRRPIVQLAAFGVLFAGLLATGSRGGILSLVCAMPVLMFFSERSARLQWRAVLRFLVLGVLIGAVVLALPSMSEMVVTRFAASSSDQLGNRLNIWSEIWISILQHPMTGSGLNSTAIATATYGQSFTYSAHNTPLAVLLDGGGIGLTLFFLLALRIAVVLRRIRSVGPPEFQIHGTILSVAILLGGLDMLSHDMMFIKLLWTMLGLLEGTRFLLKNQRAARRWLPERFRGLPAPVTVAQ